MANPVKEGTLGKVPFVSDYVSIDSESVTIIPFNNFLSAQFIVEYFIDADEENAMTPMLFYAADFEKDFSLWIDGKAIQTQTLPEFLHSDLNKNYKFLAAHFNHSNHQVQFINDQSSDQLTVAESDLKYFEVSISKGKHVIRVTYTATFWEDRNPMIKEFSFRYALSPAYQWKSYGTLKIRLDSRNLDENYKRIYTNLKAPDKGDLNTIAYWTYTGIPVDVIMIQCKEHHNAFVRALVHINYLYFALIIGALAVYWHVKKIYNNRKYNHKKPISKIGLYGSLLLPFIVLLCSMFYYEMICRLVDHNSGYIFLILFLYPIVTPCYLFIIWLYDWGLQIKYSKKNEAL